MSTQTKPQHAPMEIDKYTRLIGESANMYVLLREIADSSEQSVTNVEQIYEWYDRTRAIIARIEGETR